MTNVILTQSANLTMTTREIASLVNSRPDNIKRSAERLFSFRATPLEEHAFTNNGQECIEYILNKTDSIMLVAQNSPQFLEVLVKRWEELEAQQAPKLPTTFAEALQLAADQAKQLELAAPKVAFVDNCVERSHLMTATQVAQKHNMSAIKLNRLLVELDVYNKAIKRAKAFKKWFIDDELGEMKQTEMGHSQCLFTTKGEQWVNRKFIDEGVI